VSIKTSEFGDGNAPLQPSGAPPPLTFASYSEPLKEWTKEIGEQCKWDEYISKIVDREDRETESLTEE